MRMIQLTKLLPFISSIKHFETLMVVLLDGGGPGGPLMMVEKFTVTNGGAKKKRVSMFQLEFTSYTLYAPSIVSRSK